MINYLSNFLVAEALCSQKAKAPQTIILAAQGEVGVLPCFQDLKTNHKVRWIKHTPDSLPTPKVILALPKTDKAFERATFEWGEDGARAGNLSLSLRAVGKSDEGLYTCEVWDTWNCIMAKDIALKVRGNIILFSFAYTVYVD